MENDQFKLPENAHRELKPGEEYEPILSKNKKYQEVTVWSVCIGLLMTILFSAAAAYLGLKVGQVFEAAIPIAIIAIGLTGLTRKNDALSQNVIIQSIGGCSGGVVAVASGKGNLPCCSFTKYLRKGMRNRMPKMPPSKEAMNTCQKLISIW